MLKKRNVIFIFILIVIIVLCLNGCTNNKKVDITDTVKINFNYLGRNVEINEKTDINNINYIISKMEKQPTEEDVEDGDIKGYFTLSNGIKVSFKTSDNNIIIGDFRYYAQNFDEMLWNIFSKYIYDIGFINEKINVCNMIKLNARDVGVTYILNDSEKLTLTEMLSNFKVKELTPGISIEYPYYEIIIETGNNSVVNIKIINNRLISVKDDAFFSQYSSTDDLYKYVSTLLPVEKIEDKNNIGYLFNASKVTVNKSIYKGEYTSKVTGIVRILYEGIKQEINESTDTSEKIQLVFTINNETYNVYVYENHFIYLGNRYSLPSIFNIIINTIAAG